MKDDKNNEQNDVIDESFYTSSNDTETDNNDNNIESNNVNPTNNYQEKQYTGNYIENHLVTTKSGKASKLISIGFYLLVIVIGVGIFFMFRADKYEFYLTKNEVSIGVGSSYQIELRPKDIRYFDYLNYNYKIEDESIATVDKFGTITAVGSGTTTLSISLSPSFSSKKMTINSIDMNIENIDLLDTKTDEVKTGKKVTMNPNQTITLRAVGNNKDKEANVTVKYKSSNENVAVVDDFGNVTAKGEGVAVITGEKDNVESQTIINVEKSTTIIPTETETPTVTAKPTETTKPTETIKPTETTKPTATAKPTETTKPSVTTKPTATAKPSTTTKPTQVKVTKVEFGSNQVTKYVGDTLSLSPSISPSNATPQKATWSSSDTKIATVNQSGQVQTLKSGTVKITVNIDGKEATCTVIVKDKETTPTSTVPSGKQFNAKEVNLSKTSLTINKGKTATFEIKVTNAAGLISVSSSNTNVAKVTVNSGADCNDLTCFFDAPPSKESTVTYTVTAVNSGTAYINVNLDDLVSYDVVQIDEKGGKIGILVK